MRFVETPLKGAYVVELDCIEDERGFFARCFCAGEFAQHGLDGMVAQCNVSFNRNAGTLRGLHFQIEPHAEAKLVRCTLGAIYDVIVDLRPESTTRYRWFAVELSAQSHTMLFVPKGFAHGFQTLMEASEVFYQMSECYHRESARGVRWDDPKMGITWPIRNPILSDKDRNFPLLDEGDA